jgi:hypothetical protein
MFVTLDDVVGWITGGFVFRQRVFKVTESIQQAVKTHGAEQNIASEWIVHDSSPIEQVEGVGRTPKASGLHQK